MNSFLLCFFDGRTLRVAKLCDGSFVGVKMLMAGDIGANAKEVEGAGNKNALVNGKFLNLMFGRRPMFF
jgi:hypothetical protein